MSSFQEKLQNTSPPQLPPPSVGQLFLFCLLLGWLAVTPMLVWGGMSLLPVTWSSQASNLLGLALLSGLLFIPFTGFAGLVYWRRRDSLWPLALVLLVTSLYIIIAVAIRTASEAGSNLETGLRLIVLTVAAVGIGGLGLWRAGVPRWLLGHAFGFDRPPLAGLLLTLVVMAVLTIGWPLAGALGDSWGSLLILLQALAVSLPEEILFRGAVLGLITSNFQQRKALAALLALLTYIAFTPSMIGPHQDWSKLVLLISAIPFALLVTELRALTGSIWTGLLFAWAYRAFPPLFTDPRVELAVITQPWQTIARLWMVFGAGGLALVLWGGRQWLAPRWRLSGLTTTALALSATLFVGGLWLGLWLLFGRPGFYNDGFLIIMAEQADLSGAEEIEDLVARRAFVRERLLETAERTQAPVREALEAAGLDYRPFYLINMIAVSSHHRRMNDFANLPGVARVMLNPNVRAYPFPSFEPGYGDVPQADSGVEWNISQVQADKVWAMNFTGQGIVVAGQDTGYDWQHPALHRAYRGFNSSGEVDHNYHWHDAWSEAPAPIDDDRHGTHTMGTILGDDGQGNQIGMAPGARWIGCRNMRRGLGNPASYTECMEFFLAPYPLGGNPFTDGDVSMAPHVINNSWGCPDIEGCDDTVLEPATAALRTAGIMMVVSAGNDGPGCQTVFEPPARYDDVFSVGATNGQGLITGFSSRGPVPNGTSEGTTDPSLLLKPDIAAPGDNVRSSIPGSGYGTASGTSMAGPHVTGLVALLWSANPDLIGQIEATEQIIGQSARPVAVNATCALESETPADTSLLGQLADLAEGNVCACGDVIGSPNNVYGWGEINALEAVKLALEYRR